MNICKKLGAMLVLSLAVGGTVAAGYPENLVRVVITTVPDPLDAFARIVQMQVQQRLKKTFVVDNKPGAGGNIAAEAVAKSPADGYTLLFALDTTFTVNLELYEEMPFDVAKDFSIISVPVTYSQVLAVNPAIPANDLADFVKYAKTKKLSYASGGNGSPSHLTMAAFLNTAGIDMIHIPYKGTGQSVIDVMSGQVDSVYAVGSSVLPQGKTGKLRAIAISGNQRSSTATDVPTVAAPAGTPPDIIQLLVRELTLAMNTPEVRELNRVADYAPTNLGPQESAIWLRETRKRWGDVITKAKISLN